ncbi:MAG: sigma-70 family RNA polymerase sigma factor [Bacteroidales bacterium]|nr:sigma-70 family RNA polymerase sigma factor [Bacteroidales bacterium]
MRTNVTLTAKELNSITEKYVRPTILSCFKNQPIREREFAVKEVLCDFYYKLAKNMDSYNENISKGAWFSTIAAHCAIDYLKDYTKRTKNREYFSYRDKDGDYCDIDYSEPSCSIGSSPDYQLLNDEAIDLVKRAVRMLGKEDALIIELKMKGYSNDEIGEELGINDGVARTKICRARKRFEECLAKARMSSEFFVNAA